MIGFGVDVGGSGVKGASVDLENGSLAGERSRIPTPQPATPKGVTDAIGEIIALHAWDGPLGVTIPGVVVNGVVRTVGNIDHQWVDLDAQAYMREHLQLPVAVINDADAAGLAEARYGKHGVRNGVVLVLTFGTGIGSALIHNGVLVPNTEFGHVLLHGMLAEEYAAGRLVKRDNMDIDWWAVRVNEYLQHIETILTPETIIIGGGISKRFDEFADLLDTRADVEPARLRNNAGIVGAAMISAREEPT